MRKGLRLLVVLSIAVAAEARGEVLPATANPAPASEAVLGTIVVTGRVTGPGMWHAYKDDDHDLWIMGTLSPLPDGVVWDASDVRDLVAGSQEVLWAPVYGVNVKANLFQQAMLGIGYMRAKKNPNGQSLKEVLPPDLYARWLRSKNQYLPHDGSVENKRPIVAAQELFEAAVKRSHLSYRPVVYPEMKDVIEENGIKSTFPQVQVNITSDAAKEALADIRQAQLDDEVCLAATIDAVETDIPRMVSNANAWASGKISRISFAALQKRDEACSDAMMNPEFSAKYGLPNIKDSIRSRWISEAESALARNKTTVAFVPMENLVGADSYLDTLRAKGYSVIDP
jgi:hypothetical protein